MKDIHKEIGFVFVASIGMMLGLTSGVFCMYQNGVKDDGRFIKRILGTLLFLAATFYLLWRSTTAIYDTVVIAVHKWFRTRRFQPPAVKTPLSFKAQQFLRNLWQQKATIGLLFVAIICLPLTFEKASESFLHVREIFWTEKISIHSHFSDFGSGATIASHSPASFPKPLVQAELSYDSTMILFDDPICWNMQGHYGLVSIKLANKTIIHGVTLRSLGNPQDRILAPKDITLAGYNESAQNLILGHVVFNADQNEQYFKLQNCHIPVTHLTLYILNNHGYADSTILCRVIVHGVKLGE